MARSKPKAIGFGGSALGFLWGLYSKLTTAEQLPADAGWAVRMITDPPIYLPWLVMAASIVLTVWAFLWPREPKNDKPDRDPDSGYNQTHSGSGDNTMNF